MYKRYAVERREVMLSIERRVVWRVKRVGMYGTMLKSGRMRRAVANCLLRVVFSCSRFRIKFSCSVIFESVTMIWGGRLSEVMKHGKRTVPSSSRAPSKESSDSLSVG